MSVLRTSIGLLRWRVLATASGIATTILLLRAMSPEEVGRYSLVVVSAGQVAMLAAGGLGVASAYLVSVKGLSSGALAGNLVAASMAHGALGGALFWAALEHPWPRELFAGYPERLLACVPALLPFLLMAGYLGRLLQGMGHVIRVGRAEALRGLALFLAASLLALGAGLDSWRMALAYAGSYLLISVLLAHEAIAGGAWPWRLEGSAYRAGFAYGIKERVGVVLDNLTLLADRFFLQAYWGAAWVGQYHATCWVAEKLWYLPDLVGQAVFPHVTDHPDPEGAELTAAAARSLLALNALAALAIAALALPLITLLFGAGYREGALAVPYLLPGVLGLTLSKILKNYLLARGHPGPISLVSAVACAANLALNAAWVPTMQARGAALASSVSYLLYAAGVLLVFLRLTGLPASTVLLPRRADWERLACGLRRAARRSDTSATGALRDAGNGTDTGTGV